MRHADMQLNQITNAVLRIQLVAKADSSMNVVRYVGDKYAHENYE